MSLHFEKLKCGSRAILLMAEAAGITIDPDELWSRFHAELSSCPEKPGAIYVSSLIDMARSFHLAHHIDLTHDIAKAASALKSPDVIGVLVSWERARLQRGDNMAEEIVSHGHIAHLRRCVVGDARCAGYEWLEVLSPRWPGPPDLVNLPTPDFVKMMAAFWIFYRP